MNHLAHLLIAETTGHCPVATLHGDFVKGRLTGRYFGADLAALRLHRMVDSFTDRHPITRESRALLDPEFRRYAGVLTDLFHDYFLATDWHQYHSEPLQDFANRMYRRLARRECHFPPTMQVFSERMRTHNLLVRYGEIDIISQVAARLGARLRRDNPLHKAGGQLVKHRAQLRHQFCEFFPLLLEYARQARPSSPGL